MENVRAYKDSNGNWTLEVKTDAGVIRAYANTDPGQPGIIVMLRPEGYFSEIDCSSVTVYEDPEYRTKDNEGDMDVVIHTYGDAYSEDYSGKDILRRGDLVQALSGQEICTEPGKAGRKE